LVLSDAALRVGLATLSASCPNLNEDLPYDVRSPVGIEALQIFVAVLQGAAPLLTTVNIHELLSPCNELGFIGLQSQVSDFISAHSVAHYEARQ
jgi:hypothetical protein